MKTTYAIGDDVYGDVIFPDGTSCDGNLKMPTIGGDLTEHPGFVVKTIGWEALSEHDADLIGQTHTIKVTLEKVEVKPLVIPPGFSVNWRNYGHWDIYSEKRRAFRIRGVPGKFITMDEREEHYRKDDAVKEFKTVQACMGYITDLLMFENIVSDGFGNNIPAEDA